MSRGGQEVKWGWCVICGTFTTGTSFRRFLPDFAKRDDARQVCDACLPSIDERERWGTIGMQCVRELGKPHVVRREFRLMDCLIVPEPRLDGKALSDEGNSIVEWLEARIRHLWQTHQHLTDPYAPVVRQHLADLRRLVQCHSSIDSSTPYTPFQDGMRVPIDRHRLSEFIELCFRLHVHQCHMLYGTDSCALQRHHFTDMWYRFVAETLPP